MTGRMLMHATDLRRAAEILDRAHREAADGGDRGDMSAALRGVPILRAQSAEIALKALWRIGRTGKLGEPPRRHSLTWLHDALPGTMRELLAEGFPEIPDPSCPHFPVPYRKGLRAILKDHESALADWRYAHEFGTLRFEHAFGEVLDVLIDVGRRLHGEWLVREGRTNRRADSTPSSNT